MGDLTAIDVIGCEGGLWSCALERWGGDVAAYVLLAIFVIGCVGVVWLIWARGAVDDHRRQTPRTPRGPRVMAGPELLDGSWVRLAETATGHVRAEIYAERTWQPLSRNPSRFFDAAMRTPQQLACR
jgi:hypothetical protein